MIFFPVLDFCIHILLSGCLIPDHHERKSVGLPEKACMIFSYHFIKASHYVSQIQLFLLLLTSLLFFIIITPFAIRILIQETTSILFHLLFCYAFSLRPPTMSMLIQCHYKKKFF